MMSSLGLPWTVRDDWGVMSKSVDYALTHANKPGERGTAVVALAMWIHGYLECKTSDIELIAGEIRTAQQELDNAAALAKANT